MSDSIAHSRNGAIRDVYTVSELNMQARALLEERFPRIWVQGEISNLARPRSGHIYFSLKDDRCQLRCAMFRMHNQRIDFTPEDGMQVLAQGRVSIYPERGDFQLIVQFLEEAGAGALRRAFEALKQRLAAEGLFDEALKRPIPALPRQIGVVTSPTGAALHDIVSILARRFPAIPVLVYPVPVQGADAAPEIARMLDVASARAECDVLILARGGGSLEDLWAFNDEGVARAIRRSQVPVVTGVGHEVDVTIADFAADARAATPSAAAELVSPDVREWRQLLAAGMQRLERCARRHLIDTRRALEALERRLVHPRRRLFDLAQG
ncbi:MAG: exodeoxyribonuclease VII large subunit, partial [Gammaproteobacteria bacterium]|nr:exodeoxyribonuclease VII large subunit [Gammaproteobacteria bacterium]